MISVVGMGPGAPEYLTERASRVIDLADVIFADDRWLRTVEQSRAEKINISPLDGFIDRLKEITEDKRVAVLVSGDPGLFSLLNVIKREAPARRVEVVPGISAPQVLFARLALDWSGIDFLSLHGRPIENLSAALRPGAGICVFTDGENTPGRVGQAALAKGFSGRAVVGANLTYPDESVAEMSLEELAAYESPLPAVVYLEIEP